MAKKYPYAFEIESLKTIGILENKDSEHVDRIFAKSNKGGLTMFGSLTSRYNFLDFIFDGKKMKRVN